MPDSDDEESPEPAKPRRLKRAIVAVGALGLVGGAFALGVVPRLRTRDTVRKETAEQAVRYVSVLHPERGAATVEIDLPGNVTAYINAPIFARSNGYLQRWYADIGAHVKKGQLLATIASPEVDQQLAQARAQLAVAEANLTLSEITSTRFTELRKSSSVSQQDVDNAVGTFNANQATVKADQAAVRQFEDLQGFEQVRAPFDGTISVRNVDVGDLINAGSSTTANTELFHIVQADKLRVYVNVPEPYAESAKPGLAAELKFATSPGRSFPGKLVRTARAIDSTTRTLQVEIAVDNPTGLLFAGAYAQVHLTVPAPIVTFIVPVGVLLFRKEGLNVATVTDGKVAMKKIVAGHDLGDRIEVVQGLTGDESVVMNPPDSITTGETVKVSPTSSNKQQGPVATEAAR